MTNEDLLQKIRQANDAYREGNSIMTDVEFDSLNNLLLVNKL